MKFCICIKQVHDVSAPIQVRNEGLLIDEGRMVINAYDASALEEALVLIEQHSGEIDLLLIGPAKAQETIRKGLAMGAHRAVHILVDENKRLDSKGYALFLSEHLSQADFDVILCGKQAQDTDAGLTGGMVAELLNLPYATNAVGLDIYPTNNEIIVTRQGDTGQEIVAMKTPCLVTCSNDMNNPRIPNLKGIMQAKKKPIEKKDLAGEPEAVDSSGTNVLGYANPPDREPGRMLEGEIDEMIQELKDLLVNEAKVL